MIFWASASFSLVNAEGVCLSSVDFSEDDVHGADDGGDVGEHVAFGDRIEGGEMGEARAL